MQEYAWETDLWLHGQLSLNLQWYQIPHEQPEKWIYKKLRDAKEVKELLIYLQAKRNKNCTNWLDLQEYRVKKYRGKTASEVFPTSDQ
jgi:hypothetical protein